MEFFERAHVSPKKDSKNEDKSTSVKAGVKKQLRNMLNAYKKGNNKEIKSLAEAEQAYDTDDMKSVSDYSDIIFLKKPDRQHDNVSSRTSIDLRSSYSSQSNEGSSCKSNITEQSSANESACSVNPESVTENEDVKALTSPGDDSTEQDLSSTFDSTIPSEAYSDSEISIPSSLQSSLGGTDVSDDEDFDADGELANRILEKLGKTKEHGKKRKNSSVITIEECKETKKNKKKQPKVEEALSEPTVKQESKKKKRLPLDKDLIEIKAFTAELQEESEASEYRNVEDEITDEESLKEHGEFEEDSQSSGSSQFISVSVSDMQSQSLSDVVGDYVHPTVRNLPSEKQNIVNTGEYSGLDEMMNVEDLGSLVPEIDEELAIEDLTLETETQEQESTTYEETAETEDYFEEDISTENIDPKDNMIKVYDGRKNNIIVLKHPAELYIHGKVKLTAIGGAVEIFGYTLQDDSIDLYAPYHSFAHSIKTTKNLSEFNGLFSQLLNAGVTTTEAKEIVSNLTDYDAVIALSKLNSSRIDFVDNNFKVTDLFSKRVDQTPKLLRKVADRLGCSIYLDQPRRFLEEKSTWEHLVSCAKNPQSRGIICGGKGLGKSTLLRYYTNRLLVDGPVLVIDLDPGQAEFTMPGNISVTVVDSPLIGPNFTHLRQPEKMLNIGMINTMDNTSRYLSAVKELINHCHDTDAYQSMPWIVNTMGMCNNIGLKFMAYIISELQPTFVYQIDSRIFKKRFEFELQSIAIRDFIEEHKNERIFSSIKDPYSLDYTFILGVCEESSSPQKNSGFALAPRDERYLNVLAYFGQLIEIYGKSLLEIVPYEVDFRDLNVGFNVKIPEQAAGKVINGKIIALCQLPPADKGKLFTLADKALLCHGYGLIRGIDFEKNLLYILTPVPIGELKYVNTLVYSDWMPELSGPEKDLPSGTVIPYRMATVHQERGLMTTPRRRFNPIQLLKASRTA